MSEYPWISPPFMLRDTMTNDKSVSVQTRRTSIRFNNIKELFESHFQGCNLLFEFQTWSVGESRQSPVPVQGHGGALHHQQGHPGLLWHQHQNCPGPHGHEWLRSEHLVIVYLIYFERNSYRYMFLPPYCVLFIKVEYKFLSHIQIFSKFNFRCFEYSADSDSADLFVLFCRYRFMHEQRRMERETKLWSIFLFSLRIESDSNQILCKPDQRTEGWQPVCEQQRMCRH